MKFLPDRRTLKLSSGRTFDPVSGIIGLSVGDVRHSEVCTGSDATLIRSEPFDAEDEWTESERRELADFMIAAWTQWKPR